MTAPPFRSFLAACAALLLSACATTRDAAPLQRYDRGMVSAADPRAAEAGAEMLRAGGSATDAALAVLLTLTVVEPQSSGIGGGGFMVLDDGQGRIETIDGRETAPSAAHPRWFEMNGQFLAVLQAVPGGLSVGVPGNLALMAQAHRQHGRLPWKHVFAPSIRLARDGFVVSPRLSQFLGRAKGTAALTEQGRALYFDSAGEPLPPGAVVRNPALADYLSRLAAAGPQAFYRGENARAVANAVSTAPRNPAPMKAADLAGYRAKPRPPLCASYHRWKLCGMGPPSSGATTVLGALGMLERFDLAGMGKDSPVAWHLIAEAQRLAYADRERYLADPDFADVPSAGLIAPAYLAARSQLIAPDRTMPEVTAGEPAGARLALADTLTPDVPSTSHFAVIDRRGQAVSLTSTIEGPFGSGLMVNGYYLNNELTDFSLVPERDGKPVANKVEAGKRPRSSMAPTLVYAPDGKLRMAIGAAGGATIPVQVMRAIIGVIDWNLTADQALALPVIFAPGGNDVIIEQGSWLESIAPQLRALGHTSVVARALPIKGNAVEVSDGRLQGAADPRSEGRAAGE